MKYVRLRQELVHNAEQKLQVITDVVKMYPDKRFISFSQSVPFAEKVAKVLNEEQLITAIAYHSYIKPQPMYRDYNNNYSITGKGEAAVIKSGKNKGEVKMFGITAIRASIEKAVLQGDINFISSAEALDKGYDVPDINFAIISSQTANSNQYKQRRGRSVRIDTNKPETVAMILNLYCANTIEYGTLREAQRGEDPSIVTNISLVEEIIV